MKTTSQLFLPSMIRSCIVEQYVAIALLLIVTMTGCVSSPVNQGKEKNGSMYGVTLGLFNYRWWNFAERGSSWSDGEFWSEAEEDFKDAIALRSTDQRRARTYGMHFVDYFPHRELGIVYFRTGRYQAAINELQESLQSAESAKAKFYLNKARAQLTTQKDSDKTPPSITITSSPENGITNKSFYTIEGVSSDDTFVSAVTIENHPLFVELSQKKLPFKQQLTLEPGNNSFTVKATDISGKSTSQQHTITLDIHGPILSIADIQKTPGGSFLVSGYVGDDSGLVSLELNNQKLQFDVGAKEIAFEETIKGESLAINAKDIAGNISLETVNLEDEYGLARSGWPTEMIMTASLDDSLLRLAMKPASKAENSGPFIDQKGLTEEQDTYLPKVLVEGRVVSSSQITSISINETLLDFRPGKRVYFNHLSQLIKGENTITISAKDSTGKQSTKIVTINRLETKVHDIGARMVLGVMPFNQTSDTGDFAELAFDLFQTTLVEDNRFHLVTRQNLDIILKELQLSQTELADPATAAKIGRLAVANSIVSGTVFQKDDKIEVIINNINTETSTIMSSHDVYSESTDMGTLRYLMEGLALKLENEFPLLEGLIIKIKGDTFYLDRGKNTGLKKEMQVIVFREGEPLYHPITNKFLGADTEELGVLDISMVQDDFSVAKYRGKSTNSIRVLDKFISR